MRAMMNRLLCVLALLPDVLLGQNPEKLLVPQELRAVMGNGVDAPPFNMSTGESARYQQVYASSEFSGAGGPDLLISALIFRTDLTGSAVNTAIPNIQFDLSTTPRGPDKLSSVFSENVGSDNKTVFGPGSLPVHTMPPRGPTAFDFRVPIAPFLYHPSEGNLLLDIRNFSGGSSTFFDGQITLGDSISSVLAFPGDSSGTVGSDMGKTYTFGLVTLFEVRPVPEPGTVSLLALGLGVLCLALWKRKSPSSEAEQ